MKRLNMHEKAALLGDLHTYGGAILVAAGAGWAYPPAAPIVLGGFLAGLGLFWRRTRR